MRHLLPILCFLAAGCSGSIAPPPAPDAPPATSTVTYPAGKESRTGQLSLPSGAGPFPAVVVIHGEYGLTDAVAAQARELAGHGFATLAVDLYRGEKPKTVEDAHILDRGLPEEQVLADLRAAVDYLVARKDVRPEAVGVLGFDMGGGFALDAARTDPRLKAVVVCYGRLTTDPKLLAGLNAPVLGIFAGKDPGIDDATRAAFARAMKEAGKELAGMHVYAASDYGFLTASEGDVTDRADAGEKVRTFLARQLKP